ncbi:MAG: hypothetical protein V2I46_00215, partial [Bacteroides sp.]|nr:hypothetical protein [Bacteroides sp.]
MKRSKYVQQFAILLAVFMTITLNAQPGTGMNYQGVARDADGTILAGRELTVEVGIINLDRNQALIWEELHQVVTSPSGLFTLGIGTDR